MYVQVPDELWALLAEDGFDEVDIVRGPDQWVQVAQIAWSTGNASLGAASSLVSVYLARDQIGAFVRRLAFWLKRRAPEKTGDGDRFTLDITVGHGNDLARLSIDCSRDAAGRPEVDAEALAQTIASLLDGGRE